MSLRWRRSQQRINSSQERKRGRQLEFFRKLITRKVPYTHFWLKQNDWNRIEADNPMVARALTELNLVRTGYCCPIPRKWSALEGYMSLIRDATVVTPLQAWGIDMPFLLLVQRIPSWDCHENTGHALFSKTFLLWELRENIPHYRERSRLTNARARYGSVLSELEGIINARFQ